MTANAQLLRRSCRPRASAFCLLATLTLLTAQASRAADTVVNWASAASGDWSTAANWNPALVPQNAGALTYRAVIAATGTAYTVTAGGSSSIALGGLDVSSADATLVFDFSSGSVGLDLGAGTSTWQAGTVDFRTGWGIWGDGATSTTLAIGTGGQLLFSTASGTRYLYSLTLSNSGKVRVTSGTLSVSSAALTNQSGGLVHADGATIDFNSGITLQNLGTLRASGAAGVLRFHNTVTTADLGLVELLSGGTAELYGTITNTGATLAAPSGGSYELRGGTITGGTVADGALTFTSSGGYLTGLSLAGNLTLPASTHVRLEGGTTFTGGSATIGSSAGIYWQQAGTLAGKAITIGSGGYLYIAGGNNTLTLASNTSVSGTINVYTDGSAGTAISNAGNITHSAGYGTMHAPSLANSGTISASAGSLTLGSTTTGHLTLNSGTIVVDGSGTTLSLTGNLANTGTLRAQNSGVIYFQGTQATSGLGNVQLASGGHALLNGTLDNTGATLGPPSGGAFELYGGTISGGTIASGALSFTSSGGYLSGTTFTGDLTVPSGAHVRFTDGTTLTGGNITLGGSGGIYWQQTGTLAAKNITIASGSYLYVALGNNTLSLAANTTVSGTANIYSDGSDGTAIANAGNITHSSDTGYLYARLFANQGNITATGGTLYLGNSSSIYTTTNSGTITSDGTNAAVAILGNLTNTGTLRAQNSGVIYFQGTQATSGLGNVQLASSGRALLNGTLVNTGATLTAPGGGTFELYGGRIQGGTVASGALSFTNSGGYLEGVALAGNLTVPASTHVRLTDGTTFAGAAATLGASAGVYWEQSGTLSGKALTLDNGAYFYVSGENSTLALAGNTTVTGTTNLYSDGSNGTAIANAGNITHSAHSGSLYARSFTNSGTITATGGTLNIGSYSSTYVTQNSGTIVSDGASTSLVLIGNFTNTGTVRTQNSGLIYFQGENSTGSLGSVQLDAGGHAYLQGTLANTAANLAAPTGGKFELLGGTIRGGTIAAGALSFTNSGGYLAGATLTGNLTLPASSHVRFTEGATFTGAAATLGASAGLYWQQSGTLAGKALTLDNGAYVYVAGENAALTLAGNTTVTGTTNLYSDGSNGTAIANQGTIAHTGNTASLYARTFTNTGNITATGGTLNIGSYSTAYHTINSGSITVDGSGSTITLSGNVANTGTLRAQNSGALYFQANNTTANLGAVQLASGGHAYLNGTLDNTGATLAAPSGGSFELLGGTITGGSVASGALTFTNHGGYLDGVALNGALTFPSSSYAYVLGNTTLAGSSLTLGSSAGLYWKQSGTLAGQSVALGTGAYFYVTGTDHTLTLASNTTVSGTLTLYTDGTSGTAITNQGTLTHSTGSGTIYGRSVVNQGNITVTAGTLQLGTTSGGYAFSNASGATLNLTGGDTYLFAPTGSPITNAGRINVQAGTLHTHGSLINNAGGTIGGAGTIAGGITFAGGSLAPGNSIGALTFSGGTFEVTAPTTFNFELGATSSDQVLFVSPSGPVNLGAGLVTLSLTLTSVPVDNATYNLLQIVSGGSGITGYFSGMPANGSFAVGTYLGQNYDFRIAYGLNTVSLVYAVPEPGTCVLLALGLGVLALAHRRRSGRGAAAINQTK